MRIDKPGGVSLVERWREAKRTDAVIHIQKVWRLVCAKRRLQQQSRKQEREVAARKLQAFARRIRMNNRESLLKRAVAENPFLNVPDPSRLVQHEEKVLANRKQYHVSMCKGKTFEELRKHAEARYQEFANGSQRCTFEISHLLLQRHQTRQMIQALDGRDFSRPSPYSVCSATLLREAEAKHQERKAMMEQADKVGSLPVMPGEGDLSLAVDTQAEDDEVLIELEKKLGYNFSRFDFSM